jgi:hypothetical protein
LGTFLTHKTDGSLLEALGKFSLGLKQDAEKEIDLSFVLLMCESTIFRAVAAIFGP